MMRTIELYKANDSVPKFSFSLVLPAFVNPMGCHGEIPITPLGLPRVACEIDKTPSSITLHAISEKR